MKTLDEVIGMAERCTLPYPGDCLNCEYFDDDSGNDCRCKILVDALHYLKVLKDILDPLKVKKITHEITCPQCNSVIAILLPESNEPLTWDELKAMEGKPVWVEHRLFKGWRLIGWQANDHMMNLVGPYSEQLPLFADGCGTDWQAYKKERE